MNDNSVDSELSIAIPLVELSPNSLRLVVFQTSPATAELICLSGNCTSFDDTFPDSMIIEHESPIFVPEAKLLSRSYRVNGRILQVKMLPRQYVEVTAVGLWSRDQPRWIVFRKSFSVFILFCTLIHRLNFGIWVPAGPIFFWFRSMSPRPGPILPGPMIIFCCV